ncbi:signal peptidase complex catalytic subunit SEC11 [Colletotrichum spaethianum]|uniref:Signal peptidase complex catalytic subunit SEC11 n=1 Tax=Colletotrichum spaethianum TaxID=700344 RepID=A0AA37L8J4_9PEZI|nr:signal peptidase complex catalytic subunit SEC11 [Colletotrichum spaethianum]GKT41643.1 signal peptidase complex catalytic subunit SEC11 [Colletotrichum spaethianum]
MCQIFMFIGGNVFILCIEVVILTAVDHHHVAAALAPLSVCANIGDALDYTISATIRTNTFDKALERSLPESAPESLEDLYSDLSIQLSYPVGSEE